MFTLKECKNRTRVTWGYLACDSKLMFSVLFLLISSGLSGNFARADDGAENAIEVNGYGPCSMAGIAKKLNYTFVDDGTYHLGKPLLIEADSFTRSKFSLSCEKDPNCHGHIHLTANANVAVTPSAKSGGMNIAISGYSTQCQAEPISLSDQFKGRLTSFVNTVVDLHDAVATKLECKDGDEEDPAGGRVRKDPCYRAWISKKYFVKHEMIFNAQNSNVNISCDPKNCEAFLIDDANAYLDQSKRDLLLVTKNKDGSETSRLIVNSPSIFVYGDPKTNPTVKTGQFKSCGPVKSKNNGVRK